MRKKSVFLVLSTLLVSTCWGQITQLTNDFRTYSPGPIPTGNATNPDWLGNSIINPSFNIITIQLILINDTTLNAGNSFAYDGIDPITGVGIHIFQSSGDTYWSSVFATEGVPNSGSQRQGVKVQLQGYVQSYYTQLQFIMADTSGTPDINIFSDMTVLGTGFGIPTTLVPSIASVTSVDTTGQTGGQALLSTLVQLNNVSLLTTSSKFTTQLIYGVWTTSGSVPLIDASIGNVTTVYSGLYPNYSSLTIFTLQLSAGEDSAFRNNPSQESTFFSIVTAMPFNIVAVFDESSFPGPTLNPVQYWLYLRGASLGTDVTPYIEISPISATTTHPGGSNLSFLATGGFPPYTWSLSNYAVGTIDNTGTFTPSTTFGTTTVLVTDSQNYPATVVGVVTNTTVAVNDWIKYSKETPAVKN